MAAKNVINQPLVGAELIDDKAFVRTEFYYDFVRPRVPVSHVACGLLTLDDGQQAILGIHRPRDAGAFRNDERLRLGRLMSHVRSALFVRSRLHQAQALAGSALAALDRLAVGVVLLTPGGHLAHANPMADRILRAEDGLAIRQGSIHAANPDQDRRLQALLGGARGTTFATTPIRKAGGLTRINRPSGRSAYSIAVTPAGRDFSLRSGKAATIVFISDPELREPISDAALAAQFGFTPAEARLVQALAGGVSLPAYAKTAGVSHHTVRTQLARALSRTNTNSQLELLRLVFMSDVGMTRA
jgi:DNA-binding CsgD family transcriptional regulator/PAS domain-containing protein